MHFVLGVNTLKTKNEVAVFWEMHYKCQKLNLNSVSLDFHCLIENCSQLFNVLKNQGSQL